MVIYIPFRMLHNFSRISSESDSIETTRRSGGVFSRTRGTFLIMADVNHEQSRAATTESDDVYIDSFGNSTMTENDRKDNNNETYVRKNDDFYDADDDEILRHTTTPYGTDDLQEVLTTREGSGVEEDEVPP